MKYTYQDYLTWEEPERWELIDGFPYLMASPRPDRQYYSIWRRRFTAIYANRTRES